MQNSIKTVLTFLPSDNLFAYASEKIILKNPTNNNEKFVVGKNYRINDEDINDPQIYKLIKVINSVNGLPFNSLIVTPLKEVSSSFYSLTREDCKKLDIEYQDNYYLFSQTMDWVEVNKVEDKEYTPSDLSTYPVDSETKTIKYMILRLRGFSLVTDNVIRFNNQIFFVEDFIKTLEIRLKKDVVGENAKIFGGNLKCRIITRHIMPNTKHPIVHVPTQSIFIEVCLSFNDPSTDKEVLLPLSFFKNKNVNDIFVISWLYSIKNDCVIKVNQPQSCRLSY